ncbi:MAG: hypothetical protein Pg6A_19460 [Termitinemataceae bacterium]|nr:MAG: hypothetical protein Pg6A_19460 [Termitinemataceae bacterium]
MAFEYQSIAEMIQSMFNRGLLTIDEAYGYMELLSSM